MGIGKANGFPLPHMQDDGLIEMAVSIHHANASVDTTSPTLAAEDALALIEAAAGDQTAFESAVATVGGAFETWFDALATPHKSFCRLVFKSQSGFLV